MNVINAHTAVYNSEEDKVIFSCTLNSLEGHEQLFVYFEYGNNFEKSTYLKLVDSPLTLSWEIFGVTGEEVIPYKAVASYGKDSWSDVKEYVGAHVVSFSTGSTFEEGEVEAFLASDTNELTLLNLPSLRSKSQLKMDLLFHANFILDDLKVISSGGNIVLNYMRIPYPHIVCDVYSSNYDKVNGFDREEIRRIINT